MVRLTNGESVHTNITAIKRVAIPAWQVERESSSSQTMFTGNVTRHKNKLTDIVLNRVQGRLHSQRHFSPFMI